MDLASDLLAAADTLLEASQLYRDGQVDLAPRLAADAVELVLAKLIPLPPELRSRKGRRVAAADQYRYRHAEAEKRFGVPERDLRRLHDLRLVDRYRETAGGTRRVPSETDTEWALTTADRILRAVIQLPEVAEDTAKAVRSRLDLQAEPTPAEELLEVVEHQVGWGQYDLALKSRLLRLDRLLETRRSTIGRTHQARVLTLRAHAAMNLTQHDGPEGAIQLAKRAADRWADELRNRARVVHSLKIQSICLRNKGQPEKSIPLMERALGVAGTDPELIDSVDSERASILLALEDAEGAERLVRDALDRRRVRGDALGEADYLRPTGKALMRAGELVQAELALRRAQELTPPDYLMAQCVLAVSLTELYAKGGDKREAHRWAEAARHLIVHRGYQHQGAVLAEIIQRFPDIW